MINLTSSNNVPVPWSFSCKPIETIHVHKSLQAQQLHISNWPFLWIWRSSPENQLELGFCLHFSFWKIKTLLRHGSFSCFLFVVLRKFALPKTVALHSAFRTQFIRALSSMINCTYTPLSLHIFQRFQYFRVKNIWLLCYMKMELGMCFAEVGLKDEPYMEGDGKACCSSRIWEGLVPEPMEQHLLPPLPSCSGQVSTNGNTSLAKSFGT